MGRRSKGSKFVPEKAACSLERCTMGVPVSWRMQGPWAGQDTGWPKQASCSLSTTFLELALGTMASFSLSRVQANHGLSCVLMDQPWELWLVWFLAHWWLPLQEAFLTPAWIGCLPRPAPCGCDCTCHTRSSVLGGRSFPEVPCGQCPSYSFVV